MKKILGYGIGMVKTLLVWGIVGASCVIAYQYFSAKASPEVKQQASRVVEKVQKTAKNIKKAVAEDPNVQQALPQAALALKKLSEKLAEPPAVNPEKVEAKAGKKIVGKAEEEVDKKVAAKSVNDDDDKISPVKFSADRKQQELFDRQVAIVNDLL
jgi:predicted negative regulator of RcsB-dependent stress response